MVIEEEIIQSGEGSQICWISVSGLEDLDVIKNLGEKYGIHSLTIEDILNTREQPKVETFDSYKFLSLKTIQLDKNYVHPHEIKKSFFAKIRKQQKQPNEADEFLIGQISIICMYDVLITFQETECETLSPVKKRIMSNTGKIRSMGTDYLAYAIIDAVVDEYFLTLHHLEEDVANFEDRAAATRDETFIGELLETKKQLLKIRRAISPAKDNLLYLSRHGEFFQAEELKPFLQDLNENLNHALITVENHREWLSSIMDVNISVLTYQMNKVMKVLATISTIFIPLTFIAGIYGMNFEFMPELSYRFAYPLVLGGMGLIASFMVLIFKIRRWF